MKSLIIKRAFLVFVHQIILFCFSYLSIPLICYTSYFHQAYQNMIFYTHVWYDLNLMWGYCCYMFSSFAILISNLTNYTSSYYAVWQGWDIGSGILRQRTMDWNFWFCEVGWWIFFWTFLYLFLLENDLKDFISFAGVLSHPVMF